MTTSDGHERDILNEQQSLLFSFYSFGVMLRKQGGELTREYRADPAQMALARTLTNRANQRQYCPQPAGWPKQEDQRRSSVTKKQASFCMSRKKETGNDIHR